MKISPYCWMHLIVRTWFYVLFFSLWLNFWYIRCVVCCMQLFSNLHWLKINECIEFKVLSLTYKALTTAQPIYLHSLITVQPPRGTCSSSVVTVSLNFTNRSFRYASLHLWNQLPVSFRQPCFKHSADDVKLSNLSPTCWPLLPSITHSLFHSRLKTRLFH